MSKESARGQFVWYDLMTTDPEAAQAFYTAVAGWGTTTWDTPGNPYTMWTVGETAIGGIMRLPGEAVARGGKPHWLGYVSVPDCDATAARARELGATVQVGPEDIPTVGRFAVLADPQGAVLAIFQPEGDRPERPGMPPVGEPSWHEFATTDREAAFAFYSDLFGWEETTEPMDMGAQGVYQIWGRNGLSAGGMYNDTRMPPAWTHYIRVADIDRALATLQERGGQVVHGPTDVPGGSRIVVATDPQGGMFAVVQSPD